MSGVKDLTVDVDGDVDSEFRSLRLSPKFNRDEVDEWHPMLSPQAQIFKDPMILYSDSEHESDDEGNQRSETIDEKATVGGGSGLATYFNRKKIVDEAANYILRNVKNEQNAGTLPVANAFFRALHEPDSKEAKHSGQQRRSGLDTEQSWNIFSEMNIPSENTEKFWDQVKAVAESKNVNFEGFFRRDATRLKKLDVEFFHLCLSGDLKGVASWVSSCKIIERRRLVNSKSVICDKTILHRLAGKKVDSFSEDHYNIVRLLLQCGADPNAFDSLSWTPLFYAIDSRNCTLARILCENGADFELLDEGIGVEKFSGSKDTRNELFKNKVAEKMKPRLKECRSVFDWCQATINMDTLSYLEKFCFIRIEHPRRIFRGFKPIVTSLPERVTFVWESHTSVPLFDINCIIVGTVPSLTEKFSWILDRNDFDTNELCTLETNSMLDISENTTNDTKRRSIYGQSIFLPDNIDIKEGAVRVTSESDANRSRMADFPILENKHTWDFTRFTQRKLLKLDPMVNITPLCTIKIASGVKESTYSWHVTSETLAHVPKEAFCVLEVVHVNNRFIRGISEVFPLQPMPNRAQTNGLNTVSE
mmetsp:Transcript_27878/g.44668  ORF Transcript_27878/g.44668 Transcript_27878/m.44668 type:complete len:590 (-) Transcript_27878:2518-4287(-)